ncbi:MAG: zinc transport system substrate-binding protein [Spirochaetes bacterium]|nr:MAG: zinc transport system substrate-binding protein [Spirochaetota bacterium]
MAVSILPQAEFVTRIAGNSVRPIVLVGPGSSPHSYEPTPRQMAELSGALAWFKVGVEFETALEPKIKSLYPRLFLVDTARNVKFRLLEAHSDEEDGHEDGHEDEAEGSGARDPHVWLGKEAVKAQLLVIKDELSRLLPAKAKEFAANHEVYVRDIDAAFAALVPTLAPLRGEKVFVYHPSFGYFLDEFGILQEAVEIGGKEPTQKALASLISLAKEEKARAIFVQKQFSVNAAKAVAKAIGGVVVEIDPLAERWLENIKAMGAALAKSARP